MRTKIFMSVFVGAVVVTIFFGLSAQSVFAATYYVSPSGNDSNPGIQSSPWRTMSWAAGHASAGDIILVADGTYVENSVRFQNNGAANNPITLKAQNKWKAILSSVSGCNPGINVYSSGIIIDGLKIVVDPSNSNCSTYTSANTSIRYWPLDSAGPQSSGYTNGVIRNVWIPADTRRALGIKTHNDGMIIENSILSTIEDFGSLGTIYRNNILNPLPGETNGSGAIVSKGGSRNFQAYNNIITVPAGTGDVGIALGGTSCFECLQGWEYEAYNAVAHNNVVMFVGSEGSTPSASLSFWGAKDSAFFNNVVVGGHFAALSPSSVPDVTNATWKNNIVSCLGGALTTGYTGWAFTNTPTIDYNLFYNCSGAPSQAHPITGNPLFVNPSSDWHLQAGSPAIGSGQTISSFPAYGGGFIDVSKTFDGLTRSTPWDLGIYDTGAGGSPTQTPVPTPTPTFPPLTPTPTQAPTAQLSVSISLPQTTFTANADGSSVSTTVTATPSRSVTKVELSRDGGTPFLTDTTSPYVFTWCVTCFSASEPLPRTTTLKATAYASDGAVASATIVVSVNPYTLSSTKFNINDTVQTTNTLNVRSTPSISSSSLGTQSTGAKGTIIGGPINADGYNWWNVNYDTGADGWSAEDWLVKYTALVVTQTPTPTPTSTPIPTQSPIQSPVSSTVNLNVRSVPSASGTILGTQSINSQGTIVGGPVIANGFTWWNINYDTGADGWSVDNYLAKITSVITPTPTPTPTPIPTQTPTATPLSVSISLPQTTFTANVDGSSVSTTVTATPSRSVTKVELSRDGGTPFLTDTASPYVFTWCVTCFSASEPLPRTTTLKATAYADDGAIAEATIVVSVNPYVAVSTPTSTPTPTPPPISSGVPRAFPNAEGYGAVSQGGRGGRIIEVTNLNDSGLGSLRDAISQSGPRIVVFRVGGIIQLSSTLEISNPYITIAGQTAPGGGITISGKNIARNMLIASTHDVIVQYVRLRKGYIAGGNDVAGVARNDNAYNVIWDHNSISWTQDESFAVGGGTDPNNQPHTITHSWNLVSEPLNPHATSLLTNNGAGLAGLMTDVDAHHNLFANTSHRNPLIKNKNFNFSNNIVYNWSFYASQTGMGAMVDFISNLYKAGPLNGSGYEIQVYTEAPCSPGDQVPGSPSIYVNGNIGPHNAIQTNDNWNMVRQVTCENGSEIGPLSTQYRRTSLLPAPQAPITIQPANQLESVMLPFVGASQKLDCSGNWVSNRDAVDARIIQEYQTNRGLLISNEADVGGWPSIASGTACADVDHDAMPDQWEALYGFNPNSATDGPQDADGDGYTNVEEYLEGTSPKSSVTTTPAPTPTPPPPIPTPTPTPITSPPTLSASCTRYVATTGSDSNSGTVSSPWKTFVKAVSSAQAGDVVCLRGGTYQEYVTISNSGTANSRITFQNYPGETPVIDGSSKLTDLSNVWSGSANLINVSGNFVTIRGLEIKNSAGFGIYINGNNAVIDYVHAHNNYFAGVYFYKSSFGTVTNSTVHDSYDYASSDGTGGGGNADCLGSSGGNDARDIAGIVFGYHTYRNNEVYNCSDDGIDTWTSMNNTVEGNYVHDIGRANASNGRVASSYIGTPLGNGNAYKLGPGNVGISQNIVKNNYAQRYTAIAYDDNGGSGNQFSNNSTSAPPSGMVFGVGSVSVTPTPTPPPLTPTPTQTPAQPLSVSISLPQTIFTANADGSSVSTTVTATPSRSVTKVELSRDGGTPFLTDTASPYVFTWCVTCFSASEPLPRTTTLKATAYASDGAIASATIVVSVNPYTLSSTKFNINDQIQTINTLNVRSSPSTSASSLGTQSTGAKGTIIGGPINADGYNWWNVNYESGADGWSAEDWLVRYTAPTVTVTPTSTPPPTSSGAVYPPETIYDGSKSVPSLSMPGYLQSVIDPVFGTKITRISDSSLGGDPSWWQNNYSKDQAWNSDMTLVKLRSCAFILDGKTYQVFKKTGYHNECRWSTVDPNIIYYISGNQFRKWNVRTDVDTILHIFSEGNIQMGPWEGNLSVGDGYVVVNVGTLAIVYDIQNNLVISKRDLGTDASDWVTMSQSGNYVLAGGNGLGDATDGIRVYDRNLNFLRKIFNQQGHGDPGYDSLGNEVWAQVCVPFAMARLATGQQTTLLDGNQCGHLSNRAYKRPGWALKSGNGEVFAFKLDASGIVQRFAHERSVGGSYDASPKAVISPDGSKVMWNSDWGGGTVYAYVAEMP